MSTYLWNCIKFIKTGFNSCQAWWNRESYYRGLITALIATSVFYSWLRTWDNKERENLQNDNKGLREENGKLKIGQQEMNAMNSSLNNEVQRLTQTFNSQQQRIAELQDQKIQQQQPLFQRAARRQRQENQEQAPEAGINLNL